MKLNYTKGVSRPGWSSIATAAPGVLIVFLCSVMPLCWMAATIVANPDVRSEFSLDWFRLNLLGRTLGYNSAAALIATAMGLPAGMVLGRGRGWTAKLLWVVLPAALLMPSLSYAYGWAQFTRIIRPHLQPLGIDFRPNGAADIFRCIWSLASWLWAVPAGLIGISLRRMDAAVQQQAVLDGAFYRVTMRQLAGPIIASVAIVTVLATQEFAVYEPTGISVVATEVRMVFDTGAVSSPENSIAGPMASGAGLKATDQPARAAAAVATAAPMLLFTVILAVIAAWGATASSASDALSIGDWPPILDASPGTVAVTFLLLAINIAVPVAALIASLKDPLPREHGFLKFFHVIATEFVNMFEEFGPQVFGAIFVASVAASVATVAAFSSGGRWVTGSLAIAGASFLVGGQLLAIALIRIFNRPLLGLDEWAYNSWVVPVVAYVGRFGWLAIAAGRGVWSPPWRELREVASVDGAGPFRCSLWVVWPLAWPTLLAGGLLVGALSLTEVPATVLLMPQQPQVLTPTLMTWVHMARFDPMIEASLLMMTAVLFPALAAVLLTGVGLRIARRGLKAGTEPVKS